MSQAWQTLARNYAKFDTPLRPNAETVAAIKTCISLEDPLVVVLGSTACFADLARRVWFVDVASEALNLVPASPGRRTIYKDWLDSADEIAQADMIIGDGSINAVGSVDSARQLLRLLAENLQPGAKFVQRIFTNHELQEQVFSEKLLQALKSERYSEARYLIYGVIADSEGMAQIAGIDNYIDNIENHLPIETALSDTCKENYFSWRGVSASESAKSDTKIFFPRRLQLEAMLKDAGFGTDQISAGSFALAQYTPIYTTTVML